MNNDKFIYKDENITDIKISILEDQFDINKLLILEKNEIDYGNFIIKAAIVGASHAITIINKKNNKQILTEIIANFHYNENTIPYIMNNFKYSKLFKKSLVKYYSLLCRTLDYNDEKTEEIIETFNKDINKKENEIYLKYTFPYIKNRYKFLPETILKLKSNKNEINIKTLHKYPNNNKILITSTYIKMNNIV